MDTIDDLICFIEGFLEQLIAILNKALYAVFGLTITAPDLGCEE